MFSLQCIYFLYFSSLFSTFTCSFFNIFASYILSGNISKKEDNMGTCSVIPQVSCTKCQPGPCWDASTGSGQVCRSKESSIAALANQTFLSTVWWTLSQLCNQSLEKTLLYCPSGSPAPWLANQGAKSITASQHLHRCISTDTHTLSPSAYPSLMLDHTGNFLFPSNAVVGCLCNVKMLA